MPWDAPIFRASSPWGTAPRGSTEAGIHRRVEHWTGALERAALAVRALLDADAPEQPAKPAYFWSDQHGVKIQFAGHSAGYDRLEIEAGDPPTHSFLAVYYRGDVAGGGPGNEPAPAVHQVAPEPGPCPAAPAPVRPPNAVLAAPAPAEPAALVGAAAVS